MGKYIKLEDLYYGIEKPSAYSSFSNLKKVYRGKEKVKEWLSKQRSYSLHKPVKLKFKRRQTIAGNVDSIWQIDLCDVRNIARHNRGFNYLLTCVDIFSKFAWVVPIKRKSSKYLIEAFRKILKSQRKPVSIQSDRGSEFTNKPFKNFLKKN